MYRDCDSVGYYNGVCGIRNWELGIRNWELGIKRIHATIEVEDV